MSNVWNIAYNKRPLNEKCSRVIEIDIVGNRCVYINNHRVEGGKPYASENLPSKIKKTTVREVLDAFSRDDILAYLEEKIAIESYCSGLRNYRDAEPKETTHET